MPTIFHGFGDIVDGHLHLDENWAGKPPRYQHPTTLLVLCDENATDVDGVRLVHDLYDKILLNWNQWQRTVPPSSKNWRFEKRPKYRAGNPSPEVVLERTIARVVDDNWANQIPVDSGLVSRHSSHLDFAYRNGAEFSFIELKYESNSPLSAAIQVLGYGLVYALFRSHAEILGINLNSSPILEASSIHLRVLAPSKFYARYGANLEWLSRFEKAIHKGLGRFSQESELPCMTFGFEAFPTDFRWNPHTAEGLATQKNVLWAVHRRNPVFGP